MITGIAPGSTIIELDAPQFCETANHVISQRHLWNNLPRPENTALDLVAYAIEEIGKENSSGDYFDNSVLEAILLFKNVSTSDNFQCQLVCKWEDSQIYSLNRRIFNRVRELSSVIPSPKVSIVSGILDQIKHIGGHFRLLVNNEHHLFGRLLPDSLDIEVLRPLWGRSVTVEGLVHFNVSGKPRLIEARSMSIQSESDVIFEALPQMASDNFSPVISKKEEKLASEFNPLNLRGKWPGDEPVEELLADLD